MLSTISEIPFPIIEKKSLCFPFILFLKLNGGKKWEKELAMVAYFCNPSYLGGGDQEDHCLRPGQKVCKTPSYNIKLG
jgi:hypothetical protein